MVSQGASTVPASMKKSSARFSVFQPNMIIMPSLYNIETGIGCVVSLNDSMGDLAIWHCTCIAGPTFYVGDTTHGREDRMLALWWYHISYHTTQTRQNDPG